MTAIVLAVLVPELGTVGRKEIASLCGVAPFANDSGKMRGKDTRPRVGSALFMAAMFVLDIKTKCDRLVQSGKRKKVAIIPACAP